MITLEHCVAMSIRERVVLDELGEALRNDLVLSNPFYRSIVEFADDFLLKRRHLPVTGDWDLWVQSLAEGMTQDGTREALQRLLAEDLSAYTPDFFAEQALTHLQKAAASVAKSRLNSMDDVPVEAFTKLAEQVGRVQGGGIQGLARLDDLDTWAHPIREDALIPTGFPTLDKQIGGWGEELWIVFADSGTGKSMWLQNAASNVARAGKRVLHLTLELGIRPQIHRYYRQLAQVTRGEFNSDTSGTRDKLNHWFRLAQGEVLLLEYPAYSLTPDDLKRIIERLSRSMGEFDVLALDYLDLMTLPTTSRAGKAYEDLGRITHEVRAVCSGFDMSVLSASQAVRRPEKAGRLTMRDMGDSYQKVRGADGLLGLAQMPEEEEVHQGRLSIVKTRDSGGRGREIPMYMNRELSLIQELGHPNTVELMRRLGHLPAPTSLGGTP